MIWTLRDKDFQEPKIIENFLDVVLEGLNVDYEIEISLN